jgi:hypothetical protein
MLRELHERARRMMRNEGMRGMSRFRRPGSKYVPSPFVQELLDFQTRIRELDPEHGRLYPEAESERTGDEPPDDTESADSTPMSDDQEASALPYECNGCGKKMESYFSAVRTYFRDYHYCQDCSEDGTMDEKERERHEEIMEDLERWGEDLRKDFEGD